MIKLPSVLCFRIWQLTVLLMIEFQTCAIKTLIALRYITNVEHNVMATQQIVIR